MWDDEATKLNKRSKRDERRGGHSRHEHYCPKCKVYYKSNDKSHAGH